MITTLFSWHELSHLYPAIELKQLSQDVLIVTQAGLLVHCSVCRDARAITAMNSGTCVRVWVLWIDQAQWLIAAQRSELRHVGTVGLGGVAGLSRTATKEPLHCDKSAECITRLCGMHALVRRGVTFRRLFKPPGGHGAHSRAHDHSR